MSKDLFPTKPDTNPQIYAYRDKNPQYDGLLKVGYTDIDVQKRVAQQYPTLRPGELPYEIVFQASAMRNDGTHFIDKNVHKRLRERGFENPAGEWFRCSVKDVEVACNELRENKRFEAERNLTFSMRPEQAKAVDMTASYFVEFKKNNPKLTPHFLWNCKMRFGKTFATYELAKKMGWKRVLILTFKPAVEDAWEDDLKGHIDFTGWQFISRHTDLQYNDIDKSKPLICFGSFQDYLGRTAGGMIKPKNEWVHTINWDCVVFDEYHYGAWRDKAQGIFEDEEEVTEQENIEESLNKNGIDEQDKIDYLEGIMPITTGAYLYLSGTPFRAILSGEFIEDQIFSWTYSDEQRAKENWEGPNNPYESLPRMVMLTYQLPDSITAIANNGEFDGFDLNVFFSAKGVGDNAKFVYENEVQKWLDLIRGNYMETTVDNLKLGAKKPPLPYLDVRLLNVLSHTLWYLPNVASCYAMRNLLMQKQNKFYHDYNIVVCAGTQAGIGKNALIPVQEAMRDPLHSKSITLSCGKLTTGVTIKPWTGVFMLRNLKSPETYFQTAFRCQSPWVITNPDGTSPNSKAIVKQECYVFDFAPNRALRQIADYSCKLNVEEQDSEKKVSEFINFLPVLAYDGSSMRQIDAAGILDIAMSGTTATLLARRWESALLVNVDNVTLNKLLNNPQAMEALSNIEGFRSLNKDIETIINKSEAVKKAKKEMSEKEKDPTPEERKQLSDEEKEYVSKRKEIQKKLIKFATRIPVFMYLTDYRERTLKDVITKLEPGLFKKVTGLTVADFDLLVTLNVFNGPIMNDAVFKFRRYEDSSLSYTGINKHAGEDVGGYDTTTTEKEFNAIY